MPEPSLDLARACLVIGLVITAVVYSRTRVASGGAVTGSYLAFLLLTGHLVDVAGWIALALVGLAAIRLVSSRWPISRTWAFYLAVLVPAALHVALLELAALPALEGLSPMLVAGLYVTNGLTAYDMQRQGVVRTLAAIALVVALTAAVVWPVSAAMTAVGAPPPSPTYFTAHDPLLVLICIALSAAVHLGLGWGTAGIIGSLFLIEVLSWQSVLVLVALSLGGAVIARRATYALALSPRQRLYAILVVGSIVSWFGLFWLDVLGLPGTRFQREFGVETLLVIGLLISENVRLGAARTYGGASVVTGLAAVTAWGLAQPLPARLTVLALVLALTAGLLLLGLRSQRVVWRTALRAGDRWAMVGDTERRRFLRNGLFVSGLPHALLPHGRHRLGRRDD